MQTLLQDFGQSSWDVKLVYFFVLLIFLSPILLGLFLPKRLKILGILSSAGALTALAIVFYMEGILTLKPMTAEALCERGTDRLKEAWFRNKPDIEVAAEKDFLDAQKKCRSCACSYPKLILFYTFSQKPERASAIEAEAMKYAGNAMKKDPDYIASLFYKKFASIPGVGDKEFFLQAKRFYAVKILLGENYATYAKEYDSALKAMSSNRLDEAQGILEQLIVKYPALADDFYVKLAYVYGKKNDYANKRKMLEKALELNPDSQEAKESLDSLKNVQMLTNKEHSIDEESEIPKQEGYWKQDSYNGDCKKKKAGVCIGFNDGYIWIVFDSIIGMEHYFWKDKRVQIAKGVYSDYYHILGTNYVKVAHKK